jgi:hypothetical protein
LFLGAHRIREAVSDKHDEDGRNTDDCSEQPMRGGDRQSDRSGDSDRGRRLDLFDIKPALENDGTAEEADTGSVAKFAFGPDAHI